MSRVKEAMAGDIDEPVQIVPVEPRQLAVALFQTARDEDEIDVSAMRRLDNGAVRIAERQRAQQHHAAPCPTPALRLARRRRRHALLCRTAEDVPARQRDGIEVEVFLQGTTCLLAAGRRLAVTAWRRTWRPVQTTPRQRTGWLVPRGQQARRRRVSPRLGAVSSASEMPVPLSTMGRDASSDKGQGAA